MKLKLNTAKKIRLEKSLKQISLPPKEEITYGDYENLLNYFDYLLFNKIESNYLLKAHLLPYNDMLDYIINYKGDFTTVMLKIAAKYKVSEEAVARRLKDVVDIYKMESSLNKNKVKVKK